MDLSTIEQQMKGTGDQLSAYTANLPSEIERAIKESGSPLIQESTGVTRDLQSDYLGDFMQSTGMGPGMAGTTARDLSPTQRMGVMGRELGRMSGDLSASTAYTDYLGGQINDMYGKAVQAAQLGQQNLADQYQREMQQFQMAWQEAENEKNRQLQRELAPPPPPPPPGPPEIIIYTGEDEEPQPEKPSLTQRVVRELDKPSSPITGYDFSTVDPTLKNLTMVGINPLAAAGSIPKTIGGAIGNLAGNWRNQDMSFWDKLYNNR
jgi:hypothetical protein